MRATGRTKRLKVAGLFAGIGGVELGFHRAGLETTLLCEVWQPARDVLAARFPNIDIADDVRELKALPRDADVVTAGFPCTDISQAGRTAGIGGEQSGLVAHVFRLLDKHEPRWLVLENVRNMLPLDGGRAMHYLVAELESRGYRWAYRLVDSRFSGVPQRRQRVLLVASQTDDPRHVLLADDAGEPQPSAHYDTDAFGFYWTEGLRGLGWAQDATPTLKGGSAIGIPSPPGVWLPDAELGARLVTPSIGDAEELQGFPRGWTDIGPTAGRKGPRWKLVGNAVTVGVAEWLGGRLMRPGVYDESEATELPLGARWPNAAWGGNGERHRSHASMWPTRAPYRHLRDLLAPDGLTPMTYRATNGFFERTQRAKLNFDEEFILDVKRHLEIVGRP
jgi:DNA (cytosine-5)-methyltransferase 1